MWDWIGPAVTASVVSGIVTATGWWASHRNSIKIEVLRRAEKIRDYKSALDAEIVSNLGRFEAIDLAGHLSDMRGRFAAASTRGERYTPLVPRYATTFVFDSLLADISLLPNDAIDAVVRYYKSEHMLSLFVDDLRSDAFAARTNEIKCDMYADYIDIIGETMTLGRAARAVIARTGTEP